MSLSPPIRRISVMPSPGMRFQSTAASPRPRSTANAASDSQTLVLPDGRALGYAEYGSPTGTPLLYFHGFPASRLEAYPLHSIASRRNIRLLSLDRPGFGLSTLDPTRRITDWPADVQAFAAQVGLSRFAVLGVSGGGPYALACAKQLPAEMLNAAGVLAGATVWDGGAFGTKSVPLYARILYLAANYWPSGTRVLSDGMVSALRWIMRTGPVERWLDGVLEAATKAKAARQKKNDADIGLEKEPLMTTTNMEEEDKQHEPMQSAAHRRERLMGKFFEGFAQGSSGFVYETRLLTRDWGFKSEDITYNKVQIWHGSRDANAPVEGMRDIAKRIPYCVLKEYDENHYGMGHHLEEVLEELIPETATGTTAEYEDSEKQGKRLKEPQ